MKTHLIFIIQAYDKEEAPDHISNVVTIEVIETSAVKALARAKELIKKPHYRISDIIEKLDPIPPIYHLND